MNDYSPRLFGTRASSNKHGFRGVEFDGARKLYRARLEPALGKRGKWIGRYGTPEEAARAYDEAAREAYGDAAFLNFPEVPTEKKVVINRREETGVCAWGHDLAAHGYERPDGRGHTCRECNRIAVARYYAKRKSKGANP